jgi:hypothetical protein
MGWPDVRQDLIPERTDRDVVALHDRVVHGRRHWHFTGDLAPLGNPLGPTAIEQSHILVAEKREHPHRVGSPPVALVAVDDPSA